MFMRSKAFGKLFESVKDHDDCCGCGACAALSGWSKEDDLQALRSEVEHEPSVTDEEWQAIGKLVVEQGSEDAKNALMKIKASFACLHDVPDVPCHLNNLEADAYLSGWEAAIDTFKRGYPKRWTSHSSQGN